MCYGPRGGRSTQDCALQGWLLLDVFLYVFGCFWQLLVPGCFWLFLVAFGCVCWAGFFDHSTIDSNDETCSTTLLNNLESSIFACGCVFSNSKQCCDFGSYRKPPGGVDRKTSLFLAIIIPVH